MSQTTIQSASTHTAARERQIAPHPMPPALGQNHLQRGGIIGSFPATFGRSPFRCRLMSQRSVATDTPRATRPRSPPNKRKSQRVDDDTPLSYPESIRQLHWS